MRINRVVDTTYLKRLDSTCSPKEIDLGVSPEGFHENRPMHGIYDLDGDKLSYCWAGPHQDRPTEFSAASGSKHILVRLERFSTGEEDIEKLLTDAGIIFKKDKEVGWIDDVQLTIDQDPEVFIPVIAKLKRLRRVCARGATDASLTSLKGLEHLRNLDLQGNAITDSGIQVLSDLPQLTSLYIDSTAVTDAALASIAQMPLRSLQLKNTAISVEGLRQLKHLALYTLNLIGLNLSDEEMLTIVQSFPNVEHVKLRDCCFSQQAMESLVGWTKLTRLDLSGTTISDQGMKSIVKIKSLTNLSLSRTKVTDESLARIGSSLPNVGYLAIKENSSISDDGLKELKQIKSLHYFWVSPGTFSSAARKKFNIGRGARVIEQ